MSRICPTCRSDCDEDAKFCPHCGQLLPSVAAGGQAIPSFVPPDDPLASRQRVYDAGVLPEETERTLQRHAPVVPPSDEAPATKATSSAQPVVWAAILVVVVIVAVVIALLVWRPWGGASTPDESEPAPLSPASSEPTITCDPANGGDQWDEILSQFGDDAIPTLSSIYVSNPGAILCRGFDSDGNVAVMTLRYPAQADPTTGAVDAALVYVQVLRDWYGFLPGPLTSAPDAISGELWRPSVDTGTVIHIEYQADGSGSTETITKDWTGSSLGGLNDAKIVPAQPSLGSKPGLSLTPAAGWTQITAWMRAAGETTPHDAQCFAKIVEGDLIGTLVMQKTGAQEWVGDTLAEMSTDWFSWQFRPDDLNLGPAKPMTISGQAALSYTLKWKDAQFRYLFVQTGQTVFVIESLIRTTAVPSLADDIDAMVDSLKIT